MPLPPDTAEPARRANRWLWLVLGIVFVLTAFNPAYIVEPAIDFKCYFVASRAWMAGENPYDFQQVTAIGAAQPDTEGTLYPYLYPPTLAMLLAPLNKLSLWWASFLWHLCSVTSTIAVVLLAMKLCRIVLPDSTNSGAWVAKSASVTKGAVQTKGAWAANAAQPPAPANPSDLSGSCLQRGSLFLPLVAVGLLFVLPFSMQFAWGQVNVLVMVLILLALLQCYGRNAELSAGALLASAALIKVTPAYLLLYFVCQRRWKVVIGFAIGAVVLAAPMLLLPSGRIAWQQFFEFLPSTGYGQMIAGLDPPLGPANFSVAGFWARLTTNTQLVAGLTYTSLFALVAILVAMHYRLRGTASARLLLLPHLIVMVVAAPYAYLHHVTFIYPGVLLTAYALWRLPERRGERTLILFALATLLTSILFPRFYGLTGLHYAFRSFNLAGLGCLYLLGLWAAELSGRWEREVPIQHDAGASSK